MSTGDGFLVRDGSSCPLRPLRIGFPWDLNLHRPCVCCHSVCAFISASVLLYWGHMAALVSSIPLAVTIFPPPLLQSSMSHGGRGLINTSHLGLNVLKSFTVYTLSSCDFFKLQLTFFLKRVMTSRDIKIHYISYETMTMLTNFANSFHVPSKGLESANTCAILPATMRLLITLSDYSLADKFDLSIVNQVANSRAPWTGHSPQSRSNPLLSIYSGSS